MRSVRVAGAAALVLVGALAVPSSATGAGAGRPVLGLPALGTQAPGLPALELPGTVVQVGPDGPVRPASRPLEALLRVRDHRDTGAWLRSVAAATRALDDSAEAVVLDGNSAFSGAGGDLDGDGREDVLTYASTGGAGLLHARRGTDGSPLWTRPLTGADGALAFALGRDLTGDGVHDLLVDDLVLTSQEETDESTLTGGTARYAISFEHRLAVVSGRDGAAVWQRVRPGRLEQSYAYTGDPVGLAEQGEYRLRATGLALLVRDSDDVDGDRLPDLVLNEVDARIDAQGTYATVVYDGTSTVRSTTRASVLRGTSGTPLLERTAADVAGFATLLPLGQVVGGPAADLMWDTGVVPDVDATCVSVAGCLQELPQGSGTLELLDPQRPDAPVWRSTAPDHPFVLPLRADLDGDGAPDLARDRYDARADRGTLEVLSSATGAVLWRATAPGFAPFVVGVQDRVALTATVRFDDALEVLLERRDVRSGQVRDGEVVPVRRATPPPGASEVFTFTSVGVGAVPDGDGDGGAEVLVAGVSSAFAFGSSPEQDRSTHASGWRYAPLVGGAPLLDVASDDVRLVLPTGDLDGDGAEDVREDVLDLAGEAVQARTTGLRLRDGRALWRTSGGYFDSPFAAGDQDGRPGTEMLQDVRDGDGSAVVSRSGADLGLRWRR